MIFFDVFGNSKYIEHFSENKEESKPEDKSLDKSLDKSAEIKNMLESGVIIKPLETNKDYLALVGNIATTGVIKANDFIKDGLSVKEISVIPRNMKISNGELEVNGNFTTNGEFIVKNNDKVVHNVDKEGNVNLSGNLNTEDFIKITHKPSKEVGLQIDARPGTGDISAPNGLMKISRQGIMFGGPNTTGKETNSAQISAGRHVANSLNIVGMSANNSASTRRVDVWAESGMHIRSDQGLKVHGHGRETSYGSVNNAWSHMTTTAPQFYMNKPLQVQGGISTFNNLPLQMPHGANITNRTTINDQSSHIPLIVQSRQDSHIQLIPHNKPNESVYLVNRNGGHFRLHSHGIGDTLHVNRDGHTFINSRNNHIPLHVQSTQDAHIRLSGRNNPNLSTYLINRNGGNFAVHQHGVADVFNIHRNGRVQIHNTTGHLPNTNDYSLEIYTPTQDKVKETSLRFHQSGRYWHQLRADNNGFRMTNGDNGNLSKLTVGQLCIGNTCINENQLQSLIGLRPITIKSEKTQRRLHDANRNAVFENTERNLTEQFRIEPL
jgi:hypothetical protein